VAVCRRLGFNRLRPDLNGREMRWRAEVLEAAGWRHEPEGSGSWSPPPEARGISTVAAWPVRDEVMSRGDTRVAFSQAGKRQTERYRSRSQGAIDGLTWEALVLVSVSPKRQDPSAGLIRSS
jgi:hypothetical protein